MVSWNIGRPNETHQHRHSLLQRRRQRRGSLPPRQGRLRRSTEYRYEHIFIDNASKDNTRAILRRLAAEDKNVKVIFNTRNFGHIRSPYYAMLQARGDAVISVVADLQDPPEMIPDLPPELGERIQDRPWRKRPRARNPGVLLHPQHVLLYRPQACRKSSCWTTSPASACTIGRSMDILRQHRRSLSIFPRLDLRHGLPALHDPFHATHAQARANQEQFLYALRPGHAGHHEPFQGAVAAGHAYRFLPRPR